MSQAGSQAVDRAAALLVSVVESQEPRSFTSLVDELGLARSTTSRLLQALERNKLVQRDRTGGFRAGSVFAPRRCIRTSAVSMICAAGSALVARWVGKFAHARNAELSAEREAIKPDDFQWE